jgi:hypothetical protein
MALIYGVDALKTHAAGKNIAANTTPAPDLLAELNGSGCKRRRRR